MPIKFPSPHVYRQGHDNHPASRPTFTIGSVEVHLGRRPPPVQADAQRRRATVSTTPLTNISAEVEAQTQMRSTVYSTV